MFEDTGGLLRGQVEDLSEEAGRENNVASHSPPPIPPHCPSLPQWSGMEFILGAGELLLNLPVCSQSGRKRKSGELPLASRAEKGMLGAAFSQNSLQNYSKPITLSF